MRGALALQPSYFKSTALPKYVMANNPAMPQKNLRQSWMAMTSHSRMRLCLLKPRATVFESMNLAFVACLSTNQSAPENIDAEIDTARHPSGRFRKASSVSSGSTNIRVFLFFPTRHRRWRGRGALLLDRILEFPNSLPQPFSRSASFLGPNTNMAMKKTTINYSG